MKHINETIAKRLREARENTGLTKVELAERLGLTKQGYNPYERPSGVNFTAEQLEQFADALGKPVTWFLGIETDLAEDEAELLHAYRSIDDKALRRMVLRVAKETAGSEGE